MAKKKKNEPNPKPSFEEALRELESIVESLEEGKVGLEESLELYEKGATLLKQGHQMLEEAEHRIEQVSGLDADGNPVLDRFPSAATNSAAHPARQNSEPNDSHKKTGPGKKTSSKNGLF